MPQELSDQAPAEEQRLVPVNQWGWPILRAADPADTAWARHDDPELS